MTKEDREFYSTEELHKHIALQMSLGLNESQYIRHKEFEKYGYDEILIRSQVYVVTQEEYYDYIRLKEKEDKT